MSTTIGDWPKINHGQPRVTSAATTTHKPVYVQRPTYEIHRTDQYLSNVIVAYANDAAYAMRICRLLREDEKLHNRKYRDVAIKVWDHVTHKYLTY